MATINAIAHRNELTPDDYYLLHLVRNGMQTGVNTQAGDTKSFTYKEVINSLQINPSTLHGFLNMLNINRYKVNSYFKLFTRLQCIPGFHFFCPFVLMSKNVKTEEQKDKREGKSSPNWLQPKKVKGLKG